VHVSQLLKVLKLILTHTFLAIVTVGLGHGVYRTLYTLIGGQRAEKVENHWSTVITLTGKSANTVSDWFNMCREVCTSIVSHQRRGKMVGTTENPIQIDEARFAGRRKYNRGRMLNGDNSPLSEDCAQVKKTTETMGVELIGLGFLVLNKAQTVGTFG